VVRESPDPFAIADTSASPIDWARLVEVLRQNQRFLLTTHVRPDCDALGSTLGLAILLEQLGKAPMVAVGYDVPASLGWIDRGHRVKRLGVDVSEEEAGSVDVVIVVDTSAWAQLDHVEAFLRNTAVRKIVLDHHTGSNELGAEEFRDPGLEATGRIVVELARRMGVDLTPEMATPLFAAISTDTGWFRFPSTTPATSRVAAELVEAGASPAAIYADLYETETLARLHLIGRALGRPETELDGRLIHTHLEREDFRLTGAMPADSEDVINLTLAVGGTQGAVILVEQPDGRFKASLRSRCQMDCAEVARQFGGGGHKAAAGAMLPGPLEAAKRSILNAVRQAMQS